MPDVVQAPGIEVTTELRTVPGIRNDEAILCGEVSSDGDPTGGQRLVFSRAGRSGAVDDGSELFQRLADKICRAPA